VTATLLSASLPLRAADEFQLSLTGDMRIDHALSRLTYGPRTGDVAAVKKLGFERWLEQQLRPAGLSEDPRLLRKLASLESLSLATWQLFEKYSPPPQEVAPPLLADVLPPDHATLLTSGTLDERRAALAALPPPLRTRVLLALPAQAMDGLPDVQVEAFNVRRSAQDARAAEQRRLRPVLADLLSLTQIETLTRGSMEDKTALLTSLDSETRGHVLRQIPPAGAPEAFRRAAVSLGQPAQLPLMELVDARVYRAVYSTHQLEEVLVDFWLNHFNVYNGKGPIRLLLTSYERDAIRPHALGRFRDLLLATARHPAMLFYLDNWRSQSPDGGDRAAPGSAADARPRGGLNENYARELLELHTLGVDGGYSQQDVIDVARAFTGWTIHEPQRHGEFFFNPAMHDRQRKTVLGHTLNAGGGERDGLQVVDILARHPSTATFISRKLAQRFVADEPPASLVARMAATFIASDGDIRAVIRTMVSAPAFLSKGAWRAKVKSPFELVVSALRALDGDVSDTMSLAQRLSDLGQPLYGKLEPTGYPEVSDLWVSSASVLGRFNFALALAEGRLVGVTVDAARIPTPRLTRPAANPPATLSSPIAAAALAISAPEFQKR
jgi:uncharacterized protein (DUF1800 family)